MKQILGLAFFLLFVTTLSAQGWIKKYDDYSSNWLNGFGQQTLDGGYVMVGYTGTFTKDIHIKKVDIFGQIQWTLTNTITGDEWPVGMKQIPSTGEYLVLYQKGQFNGHLLKVSATGQIIYDIPINVGMNIWTGSTNSNLTITSDNHLLITSCGTDTAGNNNIGLAKLDLSGNVLWSQLYHQPNFQSFSMDVIEAPDGNYVMAGHIDTVTSPNQGNGREIYIVKTDTAGNMLWDKVHKITNSDRSQSIINTSDGGFLVTGFNGVGSSAKFLALKLDGNGNKEWHWTPTSSSSYDGAYGAVEHPDGSFTVVGYINDNNPPYYFDMGFVKLSATGTPLLQKGLATGDNVPHAKRVYLSSNGGYAIFGVDATGAFLMTADSTGTVYSNHIVGNLFYDLDGDCIKDAGEPTLSNHLINVEKATEQRYGVTDAAGDYIVEVDTGTYTVTADHLSPYWQFCQNPQTITFNNFYSQDTANFAVQVLDTCTYMEVNVGAPILRRCFPATYYVNYSNLGTKDAQNSYVEVTLDPYLTFDSSSIAPTNQVGNVYRFDLGTVPSLASGAFQIYVTVDCDSTVTLGQTHCVEAHIFPDTVCMPNYWSGPIIQATSTCSTDSVTFRLENVGTNMVSTHNYTIIEEHVMIQAMPFMLGSGQDQFITIPAAPGATYRIEADQANGFPALLGDSVAISNMVGCNAPPIINIPNILNQFYNGNSNPSISVDCQNNRGAYDPNDKQGQPLGYGAQHYIENHIPLNYHIRFQNTGTDTAFTVVVVDTLDEHLDPATIQMGASSHAYTWELREGGILVVTFDNIMLPDSNVNEPASNGFFKFQINQAPNNPTGTVIYNRASIYFDFNAPIMTNTVFHTIGDDFVTVLITGTDNVLTSEKVEVTVYPNPFKEQATLEVIGGDYQELRLTVYDIVGQQVWSKVSTNDQIKIRRNNLTQGAYIYRLEGDGELINTGKLIIK